MWNIIFEKLYNSYENKICEKIRMRRIESPTKVRRFGVDENIFCRNSDPIAEAKAESFENLICFNSIKQYVNLSELKWIKSNSIFIFFLNRIGFIFIFCRIGR